MGYRSEVVVIMNKTALDKMPENVIEVISEAGVSYSGTFVRFEFGNVKWDSFHDEVKLIEIFILDNCDDAILMRVGDDNDDIETIGYLYETPFDAYIQTYITSGIDGDILDLMSEEYKDASKEVEAEEMLGVKSDNTHGFLYKVQKIKRERADGLLRKSNQTPGNI